MKVGIVVGEASGDLLGANLIQALRARYPELSIEGVAGPAMRAQGCHTLYDMEELAVMGFIEPLKRLPRLLQLRKKLFQHFSQQKPDLFIGIDAPDFNLGLEKKLHQLGIKTMHYVSPSVWAWRRGRVKKIAKAVDKMLTLFPFEEKFYQSHHISVNCVGHPLAEQIPLNIDKKAARRALCLDESAFYIAILPGSRKQELRYMMDTYLQAAVLIKEKIPEAQFLTSQVNEDRYQQFYSSYQQIAPQLPLHFFTQRSHDVMAAADMIIVTCGTATLEAMLYKKPMVIAYKMSGLTHTLAKFLVKIPHVGIPNILANELLVPELIQEAATPAAISQTILDYYYHPDKILYLQNKFNALHNELRKDTKESIIAAVSEVMAAN